MDKKQNLGIAAAEQRTREVDALVGALAHRLSSSCCMVALGAYGRKQLTPRSEIELLFLHRSALSTVEATQSVCYPLWEKSMHVEPFVRTLDECATEVRRSWSATSRFLDARYVAGDRELFAALESLVLPLRRDRDGLRHRLRNECEQRHATHPSATASSTPDLVAGRGGLLDIQALHWLELASDVRTLEALDFVLASVTSAEEHTNHATHVLSPDVVSTIGGVELLPRLYAHARWVAFRLDGALTPSRDDRQLGRWLSIRDNELVANRPPPLERAPFLGLRAANVVGLARPSSGLMDWAQRSGRPLEWQESALEQLWLLLRAADWRAWDFLDVTRLLLRYVPELESIWRKPGTPATAELAVDIHSFLALRRLHEASEGEDLLVRRAWRAARQRDCVYLAVLLHELSPEAAADAARRLNLSPTLVEAIELSVGSYQSILETATRRDLHDEDLVLELATRIGNRQRLGMLFLVAVAHETACGSQAWSPWKANLARQLFGALEMALRQPAEVGARRARALEQRRERIVRALYRRNLPDLVRVVGRLPRRYVLTRSPDLAARHLALLERGPLADGEVRMQALRHQAGVWDLLVVARDRPGLLATLAGVLALRGASVLGADAATSSDGLVLDVFTVGSSEPLHWPRIERDLESALQGLIPLQDLLGTPPAEFADPARIHVAVDNAASQFFSVVEVRAPDQVGLLYRIASALHDEQLDIQHARIATHPDGAFDVFYVRALDGAKLNDTVAQEVSASIAARLRGWGR